MFRVAAQIQLRPGLDGTGWDPGLKGLATCATETALLESGARGLHVCTPEYKHSRTGVTLCASAPFVAWHVAASDPRGTGEGPSSRRTGCSRCSTARTKAAVRST